jgi:uncharacterized Zn finger protein
MSQQIQIECPNCDTINNVKKEEPIRESSLDLTFDCGKCGKEIEVEFIINYDDSEDDDSKDKDEEE